MQRMLAPQSLGIARQAVTEPPQKTAQFPRVKTQCGAHKGFGDSASQKPKQGAKSSKSSSKSKPKKHIDNISSSQAVERAVRIAEGGAPRPVSSGEAAKGRLDYVQVKDWGSGKPGDLGSLEVDRVTTVSGAPLRGDGAGDRPFYEQLARHLEISQARGDLNPPAGSKPLPPFEKWSFKKRHFLQYLTDLLHVHNALEAATVAAVQPYRDDLPENGEKDMESAESAVDPAVLTGAFDTTACAALGCFTEGGGLPRAGCIMRDLHTIAQHSGGAMPTELEPSTQAHAYSRMLVETASVAQDAERGVQLQDEARLRLLAHVYSNQVAHLTTGMRIGAAAAERLSLMAIGATHLYQTYPDEMDDPLHAFMGLVNGIGEGLLPKEKEFVLEELPSAFYNSSQLLTPLARTD